MFSRGLSPAGCEQIVIGERQWREEESISFYQTDFSRVRKRENKEECHYHHLESLILVKQKVS